MPPELLIPTPATGVRHRSYPFRAAAANGNGTRIEGYASVWNSRNSYWEVFVPGAFSRTLKEKTDQKPLVMGYQHREVIGRWSEFNQDETGLLLAGSVSQTTTGRDVEVLVRDGALTGLSIGFWPEEEKLAEPGEQVTFETELGTFTYKFDQWTFFILDADLMEASLVMAPSDDEARLTKVRGLLEQATRALPALAGDASWEETAYSMALLMGGRGAAAFTDTADPEHRAFYERIAAGYRRHGKTAPAYDRHPEYRTVNFAHDERDVFLDRSLRKALADVDSRAKGVSGPLSAETRQAAQRAVDALSPHLADPAAPEADGGGELLERTLADLAATRAALT